MSLTLIAVRITLSREEQHIEDDMDHCVEVCNDLLQGRIERLADSFHLLRRFLRQARSVQPVQFQVLAQNECETHPGLVALAWVPLVSAAHRSQYELAANQPASPPPQILELNKDQTPVRASSRPLYFPVAYIAGTNITELFAGLDLASTPVGAQLFQKAQSAGTLVTSAPYTFRRGAKDLRSLMLATPVVWEDPAFPARPYLRGYLVGVLRIEPLIQASLNRFNAAGVDFLLLDRSAPLTNQFLCCSRAARAPQDSRSDEILFRSGLHREAPLFFGAQNWSVLFRCNQERRTVWSEASLGVLPGGLLATLLAAGLVYSILQRAELVEAQVVERTAALSQAQRRLEDELQRVHRTEAQLRESERDLLSAQEIAGLAIWKWNWNTDQINCSDPVWRLFGQAIGQFAPVPGNFIKLAVPEDRRRLRHFIKEARRHHLLAPFEFRIQLPGGSVRAARAFTEFMLDNASQPTGIIISLLDNTASKQAETALRLQREELQERNAELSTLNTISASLNDSLATAQVFASLQTQLRGILGATAGAIAIYCPTAQGRLTVQNVWGANPEETEWFQREMLTQAVPTEPIEVSPPSGFPESGSTRRLRIPLLAQGAPIGVVELVTPRLNPAFNPNLAFCRALGLTAGSAIQNAYLFEQVRQGHQRLRELSLQLLQVQETEQRHLGRELHDQIGQLLTALKLHLREERTTPAADQILNELVGRVRQMSLNLRPAMLDELGLLTAVDGLIGRFVVPGGPHLRFEHTGVQRRFAEVLEITAFRIVQEALTNAIRHSKATSIAVLIWADETELAIHVEDNGTGFDADSHFQTGKSSGLCGMRERIHLLGGELTIDSTPNKGTRLIAELPLSTHQTALSL